jgi:hypothetical protein
MPGLAQQDWMDVAMRLVALHPADKVPGLLFEVYRVFDEGWHRSLH